MTGGDALATAESVIANLDMATLYEKVGRLPACICSHASCELMMSLFYVCDQRVYDFNDAVRPNAGFTETAPFVGIAE